MILRCPCRELFEATFVGDELQTLCDRCSLFFERRVTDLAPCWVDWEPRPNALRILNG